MTPVLSLIFLSFASLSLFSIPPTVSFREKLFGIFPVIVLVNCFYLYLLCFPFLGCRALLFEFPLDHCFILWYDSAAFFFVLVILSLMSNLSCLI